MSGENLYFAEQQLVLPSGKMAMIGIMPNWSVEVKSGGDINEAYSPEEAICLAAMIANLDVPLRISDLASEVESAQDVGREAGADTNPIFQNNDVEYAVIEAVSRLIKGVDNTPLDNILILGRHYSTRRIMLLGNLADSGYGESKIEAFFVAKPEFSVLHVEYLASFNLQFNKLHRLVVDGKVANQTHLDLPDQSTITVVAQDVIDPVIANTEIVTPNNSVVTPNYSRRKNKLEEVLRQREVLLPKDVNRTLNQLLKDLATDTEFTVDNLFQEYSVRTATIIKIADAFTLLEQHGYVERIPNNEGTLVYRRTAKKFLNQ